MFDFDNDYILTDNVFSTAFTNNFPHIQFGEVNKKRYREDEIPVNITANEDFFWSLSSGGIRIGEQNSREYGFAPDPQAVYMKDGGIYTIMDTAAKDIMISNLWYQSFVEAFMDAAGVSSYDQKSDGLYAKCTSNFPNLYFQLNGYWLVVLPDHYKKETSDLNLCRLSFAGIDAGFNIYGLPLYRDYYVSHYWTNSTATKTETQSSESADKKNFTEEEEKGFICDKDENTEDFVVAGP